MFSCIAWVKMVTHQTSYLHGTPLCFFNCTQSIPVIFHVAYNYMKPVHQRSKD